MDFLENHQVNDNKGVLYLATFNSATNSYTFPNIAHLVTIMAHENAEGKATENWNEGSHHPSGDDKRLKR